MIEIQSVCDECGSELTLDPTDLLLLLPTEEADNRTARLVHGCELCGATTVRAIEARLGTVLIARGVPSLPDLELQPAEVPHPENPPDGDRWSADDLIELHELLARDDWYEGLIDAA